MNSIRSITKDWNNKLGYMAFGCLCAIIGAALSPVTAQRDKFENIECTSLTIKTSYGSPLITLDDKGVSVLVDNLDNSDSNNNGLTLVRGLNDEPLMQFGAYGIHLYDSHGNIAARLHTGAGRSELTLYSSHYEKGKVPSAQMIGHDVGHVIVNGATVGKLLSGEGFTNQPGEYRIKRY